MVIYRIRKTAQGRPFSKSKHETEKIREKDTKLAKAEEQRAISSWISTVVKKTV
jgi:hypothetical protein